MQHEVAAAQLSWSAIQAIVGVKLPNNVLRFDEIPFHLPEPEPGPEPPGDVERDSDVEIVEEEEEESEEGDDEEALELQLAEPDDDGASSDRLASPVCDDAAPSKEERRTSRLAPDETEGTMSIESYLEVTLSTDSQASHACDACNQIFSSDRSLSSHRCSKPSEDKKYPCHVCAEKFPSYWELRKHMNSHFPGMLDSKSSFCHLCQKDYTKTGFMNHLRKHTGERPFVCELCHKAFSQSSSLSIHMKFHLNVRKHACTMCEKKFVTKSELSRHMTVHTKQKSYYCGVCDKAFTRSDNMKKHEKTHG